MDIWFFLLVFIDQVDGFFDVANAPLTQNIEFFIAYGFGFIHVPLHYGHPFWRQIQCRIIGDGLFRDEYATRMNGSLIGHILHHVLNGQNFAERSIIAVFAETGGVGEAINLLTRESHYFTNFTDDRTILKGAHGTQ